MKPDARIRSLCLLSAIAVSLLCTSLGARGQSSPSSRAATVFDSIPQAKKIDQVAISPDGTHLAYIASDELSVISMSGGPSRPMPLAANVPLPELPRSATSNHVR